MSGTADTPLLELRDVVSYQPDGQHQLDGLRFALRRGEVHGVISMMQNELAEFVDLFGGRLHRYTGDVLLDGKTISLRRPNRRLCVSYPGNNCFAGLTAEENILFHRTAPIRLAVKRERVRCRELLERFGISLNLSQRVGLMTCEECKLIELLRVYVNPTPVLILFEPFRHIRPENRGTVCGLIRAIAQEGRGVILVTGQLEDMLQLTDSISILSGGRCGHTQETAEVRQNPREFLYLLSGWIPHQPRAGEHNIFQTIVEARDILISSAELKNELLYIARDITKVLRAVSTAVYLVDEQSGGMIERVLDDSNAPALRLSDERVDAMLRRDELCVLTRESPGSAALFAEDSAVLSMICIPINQGGKICGLLQVCFADRHALNETDRLYLTTFSKEIAVAIETSRLIGRSMLLQESHHRIKNNLQQITAMIYMQKLRYMESGGDVEDMFDSVISRISSIAIVHDLLARSEDNFSIVNLSSIVEAVARLYQRDDVRILRQVEDISIPYNKAAQIALVVNELICNCVKHAFAGRTNNEIRVVCRNDGKNIHLRIADNGCGIPDAAVSLRSGSIGIEVVKSIVRGLNGTMEITGGEGTAIRIAFPVSHVYDARNSELCTK